MTAEILSPRLRTTADMQRGLETPKKPALYVVESRPPESRQRALLLQGAGTNSQSMRLMARYIERHTSLEPHLLNSGAKSLTDINYGPNQLRQARSEIKRHADESGQEVLVVGFSLGGRKALEAVMEPGKMFDPTTEVEHVITVESPIGDLRGLPRADEVITTAMFGELDLVINRHYPPQWFKSTNPEVQNHVKINRLINHLEPLVNPRIHELIVAQLGKPANEHTAA
jgi:hypothetical protein